MGLLRLMRPANIVTACADILAGYAAASAHHPAALPLLLLATIGLYGGGVVLNDVFDADLDAIERPERPIPSGIVSRKSAATLGILLLLAAVIAACQWAYLSGAVAAATAIAAIIYDRIGKHQSVLGPINMGLCRALNLLLGITAGGRIEPFHCSSPCLSVTSLASLLLAGVKSKAEHELPQ